MNKEDAQKQIAELKAKLAELEANISSDNAINPKDLIGKLCYVWDSTSGNRMRRVIDDINPISRFKYMVGGAEWKYAEPIPESEVLKLIYKSTKNTCRTKSGWREHYSRYIFPNEAKYVYTDAGGNIFWSSIRARKALSKGIWVFEAPNTSYSDWGWISRNNTSCPDWQDSEVEL